MTVIIAGRRRAEQSAPIHLQDPPDPKGESGQSGGEKVLAAAQSRKGFRSLLNPFARFADREAGAVEVRALRGIADGADEVASTLSRGEHRLRESRGALATDPPRLRLAEPTAGMGPEETQLTVERIRKLSGPADTLPVDHDMDVIMGRSHWITGLGQGRALAEGSPAEIRVHPPVQREV